MEIHEDLIRQIEIVPEENYFSSTIINKSEIDINAFEYGSFDDITERKNPKIETSSSHIYLNEFSKLVSPYAQSFFDKVYTGHGSSKRKLLNTCSYTFERIALFAQFSETNIVQHIYMYSSSEALKETRNASFPRVLNLLGEKFNLILIDWDEEIIVRLKSKPQIQQYLSDTFGFIKN